MSCIYLKKNEKLHEDRINYLKIFYYELMEALLKLQVIDFSSIKNIFAEKKCGLLHSFVSKYECKFEFYEGFFEIILNETINENFKIQKSNMILLYLFYSTMPRNFKSIFKITINKKIIEEWINFLIKCEKEKEIEVTEILSLMFQQNFFMLGFVYGIKSIVVDNNGNIKYKKKSLNFENILEINSNKTIKKINDKGEIDCLINSMKDYCKTKQKFFEKFVLNDDNEPLEYDNIREILNKTTQKNLSVINEKNIRDLKKFFIK